MKLAAIILALLLEQVKIMPPGRVDRLLRTWAHYLATQLHDGQRVHGFLAWLLGALLPTLIVLVIQGFLPWPLWIALGVFLLFLAGGLRQFSAAYAAVQTALAADDIPAARQALAAWLGNPRTLISGNEIARLAIEQGLIAAFHGVFSVFFWFVVLGPAGIVLWRFSLTLHQEWSAQNTYVNAENPNVHTANGGSHTSADATTEAFSAAARRAYDIMSWIPVRLTALAFAVMGNFEDAVYCWRQQARQWPLPSEGILLASAAGALGVRLGLPINTEDGLSIRPELGVGEDADAEFMASMSALVWRTLVVSLGVLAALSIAAAFRHF